jgi:hypothetical protein
MKSSLGAQPGSASAGLLGTGLFVGLVLMLGATVYLWRSGNMRPQTAYWTMVALVAVMTMAAFWARNATGG